MGRRKLIQRPNAETFYPEPAPTIAGPAELPEKAIAAALDMEQNLKRDVRLAGGARSRVGLDGTLFRTGLANGQFGAI